MKNLTKLTLIGTLILGLNSCGEEKYVEKERCVMCKKINPACYQINIKTNSNNAILKYVSAAYKGNSEKTCEIKIIDDREVSLRLIHGNYYMWLEHDGKKTSSENLYKVRDDSNFEIAILATKFNKDLQDYVKSK